jgi:ribA/ribD-fused uncharacterized protein
MSIKFYRANDKLYGFLSNCYRCKIVFDGRIFDSSERAYQFGKFRDEKLREWFMSYILSPRHVAIFAHALQTWDISPGWSKSRIQRMKDVVRAKFTQNKDLRQLLLDTGDEELIELGSVSNPVNRRWGMVEAHGKLIGQNLLGQILMEVRAEL